MDISQVAKQSGLAASTLRYYEQKGLIQSVGRRGLKRVFSIAVMQQLALISLAQAAGFSLDEIGHMFNDQGEANIDRKKLRQKADEIDLKINRLQKMRDGLRHAANCSAENHLQCPKFVKLLDLSIKANKMK